MKIGVISDTHLTSCDKQMDDIFDRYFKDVDLILHAGDLVHADVLDAFRSKNVQAVCGNMDPPSLRSILPDKMILALNGFHIGLIHGWGSPVNLEEKLLNTVGKVDCLIYGHTHRPVSKEMDGVLFFNPGSATDRRFSSHNTVGIMEINKIITARIIEVPNFSAVEG